MTSLCATTSKAISSKHVNLPKGHPVIHINLLLGAGQLVPKKYCRIKVAMKLFMSKNFFNVKIKSCSWGGEKNE